MSLPCVVLALEAIQQQILIDLGAHEGAELLRQLHEVLPPTSLLWIVFVGEDRKRAVQRLVVTGKARNEDELGYSVADLEFHQGWIGFRFNWSDLVRHSPLLKSQFAANSPATYQQLQGMGWHYREALFELRIKGFDARQQLHQLECCRVLLYR